MVQKHLGANHGNWKGGRNVQGRYITVYRPDHPFANSKKRVLEHRVIYEEYYNCCLLPWTDIHHIDGNRYNNSIENLQPMFHSKHMSITNLGRKHKQKKFTIPDRICILCDSIKTTLTKTGRPIWRFIDNKVFCHKCYMKLYIKGVLQ